MFSSDRKAHRRIFTEAWRKALNAQPLEPLEIRIVEILRLHPEYQPLLESGEDALERDFHPDGGETNPFFHLGLHLAILDQVSIDQPHGIRSIYAELRANLSDSHALDHHMMDCLAQALWLAQQGNGVFDERGYLDCVRRIGQR